MERLGLPFHVDLEMPSSVSVKRLIASGGAYSIMPYSAISEEISRNSFTITQVPDISIARALALPAERGATAECGTLIELIDSLVTELIANDPVKGLLPVQTRRRTGPRKARAK